MRCNSDMGHKVMTSPTGRKPWYVVGHCMLSHWFTSSLHTITLYEHTGPVADARSRFPLFVPRRPPPSLRSSLASRYIRRRRRRRSPPPSLLLAALRMPRQGAPLWETDCRLVRSPSSRYSGDKDRLSLKSEFSIEREENRGCSAARSERSDLTIIVTFREYQPCKFKRRTLFKRIYRKFKGWRGHQTRNVAFAAQCFVDAPYAMIMR